MLLVFLIYYIQQFLLYTLYICLC